ncbi:MAG: ABC transporter permease [Propioniciclava sp.]|uniref:ABC transporter permease subunit n=1 Tax=Propioniciclava sp. TaxID=2038686 RepID=UPI0039E54EA0
MIRLVRAESSRWFARRGLWITLAGVLVLMGFVVVSIWFATAPPSGEALAQNKKYYAQAVADWERNGQQYIDDCLAEVTTDADRQSCREMGPPKESDYLGAPMSWENAANTASSVATVLGGLAAMLMAASFWGGEYRQGSISTWLTFVPSRGRVWSAKMIVVALAGALVSAACAALGLLGAWISVSVHQGVAAVGPWADPLLMAARGLGLGAMFAVIGGALAVAFRNTFAAVALPMGYLFAQGVVNIVRIIPGADHLATWMPENNVLAYLSGGWTVMVPVRRVTAQGVEWESVERLITFGQGLVYLLVVTALFALASWVLFRRRDIAE